jgi:hypothetical protein
VQEGLRRPATQRFWCPSIPTVRRRPDGPAKQESAPALQISNRAQQRLHHLYTSMKARGKHHNVTIVAVARELSCFLWAAATAS